MELLRVVVGQPFSPTPMKIGSRLSFDFSRLQHSGGSAPRRAYPRIKATPARGARTVDPKLKNRRPQKKFNGMATKPMLSVFCSNRQLYAVLADDHNKKILFYGNNLQRSIGGHESPCTSMEAARRIGEELVRACEELSISEVSYDIANIDHEAVRS